MLEIQSPRVTTTHLPSPVSDLLILLYVYGGFDCVHICALWVQSALRGHKWALHPLEPEL